MTSINGLEVQEVLYQSRNTTLYRQRNADTGIPMLVRYIGMEFPDPALLLKMKREFELFRRFNYSGVARAVELRDSSEGIALVMQDVPGVCMEEFLKNNPLPLDLALQIGLNLVELVAELHRIQIVHKNINPANFIIDPASLALTLVDLSIAMQLDQELVGAVNHKDIEGSLAYISPEQTGRINRPIDYRTDYYSLGVVMYRLFTGVLPFTSEDTVELVHAQIAKMPMYPGKVNANLPAPVSEILMKLLEKAPDNRYKSTRGILNDLQNCLDQWRQHGRVEDFKIGQRDRSERFTISEKLYGREKEISELFSAFDRTAEGERSLAMVGGYSGIGKSSLINEITKSVVTRGGFFISGKFDQFHRDIPYSAGITAFRMLVRQLLSEPDAVIAKWKEKLNKALGANAKIVTDIIPELELIIGKQPEVIPLPPSEALNRINLAFISFMQAFAKAEHPLVVFLDDLQWADRPTIDLIRLLLTDKETTHFLIAATYRNNEVDATHPLLQMVRELKESQTVVREIDLQQLSKHDLQNLVSDSFLCSPETSEPLAALLLHKTGGNPFFVNEFLKTLHHDKLVAYDPAAEHWVWDIEKISKLEITDNVVELMIGKIRQFEEDTQNILKYVSCVGGRFDLQMAAGIHGKSAPETAKDLWPAVREGLVVPIGNAYRIAEVQGSENEQQSVQYKFLHDRVQQAAYALVDAGEKEALHLHIARTLYKDLTEEERQEHVFDLMNHYNFGSRLLDTNDEKIRCAELNLFAGRKAKSSAAYEPSYKYLEAGINILPSHAWQQLYPLTLDLFTEGSEAAYLSGKISEMESLTQVVIDQAHDVYDSARATMIRIRAYVSLTKNEEAFKVGEQCLKQLGVHFPANPNQLHIVSNLVSTKLHLRNKTAEELLQLPNMTDRKQSLIMELLSEIAQPSYFAKKNVFPLIVFKQINLSVKYGNHLHTAFAYVTYGIVMCGSTFEFDEGLKFGNLAVGLNEKFNATSLYSKIHFINGNFIRNWRYHFRSNLQEVLAAYHKGIETGDFLFASYAGFNYCVLKFFLNVPLEELTEEMGAYASSLRKFRQDLGRRWLLTFMQVADQLRGSQDPGVLLKGKYYDESKDYPDQEKNNDYTGLFVCAFNKSLLGFIQGDYGHVVIEAGKAFPLAENVLAWPHIPFLQMMYGVSLLKQAGQSAYAGRRLAVFKAGRELAKLKKAAKSAPDNYLSKMHFLQAEIAAFNGNSEKAAEQYQESIKRSSMSGMLLEEALAHEHFGLFALKNNDVEAGRKHIMEARRIYSKWGATAKVEQLERNHDLRIRTVAGDSWRKATGRSSDLDMDSLMKASLAISGEIQLNRLVEKLMAVMIENAGAQKGYLLISRKNEWYIEGERMADQHGSDEQEETRLTSNKLLPESIVNYVIRTNEDLVLDNVQADIRFFNDPVVQAMRPVSVLCLPVFNQGHRSGILYLENSLHSGAFTDQRVQFLKLLSGQIAVSLENALVYENLEEKVKERTVELEKQKDALEKEKQKSDSLLLNILPSETAEELKKFGYASPKLFNLITVMFTDFVNFTKTSERLEAAALVQEIDFFYSAFDQIVTKHHIEKIKTIGDSYMCAGGLPVANTTHALDVVNAAAEIRQFVAFLNLQRKKQGLPTFECRIGIHSGPVVAGIVGIKKFAYDIWGDTVNIASRMESSSETMKINMSGSTFELISGSVPCVKRGKIEAKNKGLIDMYYVDTEVLPVIRSYHSAESYLMDLVRRKSQGELEGVRAALAAIHEPDEKLNEHKRLAVLLRAADEEVGELAGEVLPAFGFDGGEQDAILALINK